MCVVAVGEHRSAPAHHAVQGARHANLQALHGARERELVGRLDDEVDVVPLDREVNEAEAEPGAAAFESAPQLPKAAMRAKVPHFLPHARGDVQRAAAETGPRAMNDVPSRALALPPCTLSCTTPERKRKLLLFCDHARSVRGGSDMDDRDSGGVTKQIRCPPFQVVSCFEPYFSPILGQAWRRTVRCTERRPIRAEPTDLERADIRQRASAPNAQPLSRRATVANNLKRSAALPRPPARRPRTPRGSAAWQAPGRPE